MPKHLTQVEDQVEFLMSSEVGKILVPNKYFSSNTERKGETELDDLINEMQINTENIAFFLQLLQAKAKY